MTTAPKVDRFSLATPTYVDYANCIYSDAYRNVKGWLTINEAACLQQYAWFASGLPGCLVEVGSYCGRSTIALASALKAGVCGMLYSIDPHEGNLDLYGVDSHAELDDNLSKFHVQDFVTAIAEKTGANVVQTYDITQVKLLFIDGDHTYESVRKDYDTFKGALVHNGFVLLHDSFEAGPQQLLTDISEEGSFQLMHAVDSITVLAFTA